MTDYLRRLRRNLGLLVLILSAALVMGLVPLVDAQWTMTLAQHKWPAAVDFLSRSLFEGDLPGANDPLHRLPFVRRRGVWSEPAADGFD